MAEQTIEPLGGPVTSDEIRRRIARVPRVPLGITPTPLQAFPRLAKDLGIGQLFVKRDDLTGLAFGGNKVRNLEFRIAEALEQGANVVVVGLESQSNSARQVTASANTRDLKTVLVLRKDRDWDWQGNLLIDRILGADIRFVPWSDQDGMNRALDEVADEQRRLGNVPYVMNQAASFARGSALAYLLCTLEIVEQADVLGVAPTHLYMASGNKGHAGLVLGRRLLGKDFRTIAISQRHGPDRISGAIKGVRDAAGALGWEVDVSEDDIESYSDYVGSGYGVPTQQGMDAIQWAARREGLLLDPIYTGKAMAGLIDHAQKGLVDHQSVVIFVHTGGLPALFAYKTELTAAMG